MVIDDDKLAYMWNG